MASSLITSWQIEGKKWKQWQISFSWALKITPDDNCSHEIRRQLFLGRKAMRNLDSVLKSKDITLLTKFHIVKVMVFLVVTDRRRQWQPTPVLLPGNISWMEEPGGLQSMGSWRVGHDWATSLSLFTFMHWRMKWQPSPVGWNSSVLAWRIPGIGKPGGLPSVGSHRVGFNWSDLAAAAVVTDSYESWTIRKPERRWTNAFGLWCWRRLLRVRWAARRLNQSILKEVNSEYSLEGLMLKLKHQYFGHLMQRASLL